MTDIKSIYTSKKKKIKPKVKPGNIRIVDDDALIDAPDNVGNTLEDDLYKDEPVVAEIIDERPEIVKKLEQYSNSKWKRIVDDEDDEIKKYEVMIANKKINNKQSRVIDDDEEDHDLDMIRVKKSKNYDDDDLDILRTKKLKSSSKSVNNDDLKIERKIKKEKDVDINEEVDETKVRVRKPTALEELEKARKEERKEKYNEWGKGMVQKKLREEKLQSDLHEAEKPLARYIDDQDLDKLLREQEREDDPMLQYIKKNNEKEGNVEKKQYKGPAPAPNRFNIKPGYRWDGLDRSNGFEKKYFISLSLKKARDDEAYKWSVEDM